MPLIYLNSANLSLCPPSVLEAMTRYQREFEENPTEGLARAWGHLWKVQHRLARFLGADVNDLFLRTNVTSVLNTFLLGMPLEKGSEILVGELEYGAMVNICRMRAARDGLSLRVLQMPATVPAFRQATAESLVELVTSQLAPQTKVLLLSHVIGGTGMVMPLKEIARETRRRGVFLVVDGAYAPGALEVNFRELDDVDFYGCSLYKWLLGPKGTAFGWVNKRHQATLQPLQAGWSTFAPAAQTKAFGGGNRFQEAFAMSGCHDFAPFRAIVDALDVWDLHLARPARARMAELRALLAREIETKLGWIPLISKDPRINGPLQAFLLPEAQQARGEHLAEDLLHDYHVQIHAMHLRGQWYAVFSPHFYNKDEEIREAVQWLQTWQNKL